MSDKWVWGDCGGNSYVSDDVLIREKVSISEVGVVTSTVDEGLCPRIARRF